MDKNIEAVLNEKKDKQKIKCIVWDLDNTIWKGVLIEDKDITLREGVVDIIKTLDERGILQSISSKKTMI
jgi:predicted enzyme involved in methoxymalonyl-ACP biosynthesis